MSNLKNRISQIEGKMKKTSNYAEIVRRHSIETRKGCGPDEAMTLHTIMALYINSYPEHKGSNEARNYLEWMNNQSYNAIPRAYAAIQDLIAAGLATVMPTEFVSDGRSVAGMIPPYPYLCNPEQILNYSDSRNTQFWTNLQ